MRYVPELDGLRAVAVTAVILFHSHVPGFTGGFVGVDLFFVLSAFLISSILAAEWHETGSMNLKRFYWRRLLRLTPPLFLMLAAYVITAPFIWPGHDHARDALIAGLYISDYTVTFFGEPQYLQHTWSLAIEEQFYLLWPLLLAVLLRAKRPISWLIGGYVVATLWRSSHGWWEDYYFRFDTHETGLILGALLFFAMPYLRMKPWVPLAGAALFLEACFAGAITGAKMVIPPAEFAAALLIASVASGQIGAIGPLLQNAPAVRIGKLSYGMYLWHVPIAVILRDRMPWFSTFVLTFGASVLLAAISYGTVEEWARRVRSKAWRSANPPAVEGS